MLETHKGLKELKGIQKGWRRTNNNLFATLEELIHSHLFWFVYIIAIYL